MADGADSELAKKILRNLIPLDSFGAIGQGVDKMGQQAMSVLQQLGLMSPPAQAAPPINQPLPQMDPKTGQVVYPGRR